MVHDLQSVESCIIFIIVNLLRPFPIILTILTAIALGCQSCILRGGVEHFINCRGRFLD